MPKNKSARPAFGTVYAARCAKIADDARAWVKARDGYFTALNVSICPRTGDHSFHDSASPATHWRLVRVITPGDDIERYFGILWAGLSGAPLFPNGWETTV
jgi:hypothetical protein